jgi:hypothetical protein
VRTGRRRAPRGYGPPRATDTTATVTVVTVTVGGSAEHSAKAPTSLEPEIVRAGSARAQPSSDRAMIISWISVVPPPIDASFASRSERSTWNSSM